MSTRDIVMNDKLDNRDAILQYISVGGEGTLTELQQKLFDRYSYADELIRKNIGRKKRDELATMIMGRWNVSKPTAYADIVNAEYVFCSSTPLNKKYFIQRRIEFLEEKIRDAAITNNFDAIAKLEKVLSNYIEMYPDYEGPKSPKTVIFNITNNHLQVEQMSAEEAFNEADNSLKELEADYDELG